MFSRSSAQRFPVNESNNFTQGPPSYDGAEFRQNESVPEHLQPFYEMSNPPRPDYATVDNHGNLIAAPVVNDHFGRPVNPPNYEFAIAPTISAARSYGRRNEEAGDRSWEENINKFEQSVHFSPAQKVWLQKTFGVYGSSIGMAVDLEKLVDHRAEFVLDDSKHTSKDQLQWAKESMCAMAQFLVGSPCNSIAVRRLSDHKKPMVFTIDRDNPEVSFRNFFKEINAIQPARFSISSVPLSTAYETCIGDAAKDQHKTAAYVFTSGKKIGKSALLGKSQDTKAKELIKGVVNRPGGLVPTMFFNTENRYSVTEHFNNADSVRPDVGTIGPFGKESKQVLSKQGNGFFFKIGTYWQSCLLGAVDPSYDKLDEGKLYGRKELQRVLGIPISRAQYKGYFDEAYSRQYHAHQSKVQREIRETRYQLGRPLGNFGLHEATVPRSVPITTFDDPRISHVPRLRQQIIDLKQQGKLTPELEQKISRVCMEKDISIGMGIHLLDLADHRLDFIIDTSASMNAPVGVDPNATMMENMGIDPSRTRLAELKERLCSLAPYLAHLPNKGITLRLMSGKTIQFSQQDIKEYKTPEAFIQKFEEAVNGIEANDRNTKLNTAFEACQREAETSENKTAVYVFTDGAPNDRMTLEQQQSLSFFSQHYGRDSHQFRTVVKEIEEESIKTFSESMANRDVDRMPVSLCPCTNDAAAVGWTDFIDAVCDRVTTEDDLKGETRQVRKKQGPGFEFNQGIHEVATLLGGMKALFDGIDDDIIFSKQEREEMKAETMSDGEYDRYFDQAYTAQCGDEPPITKVPSISNWSDWTKKSAGGYLNRSGNATMAGSNSTVGRLQAAGMM